MGRSARQVVEQNQGALQQTLEAIDRLLRPQQGVKAEGWKAEGSEGLKTGYS